MCIRDSLYSGIKTIFTVHNLKFQGIYPRSSCGDLLGLSDEHACSLGLVHEDTINYLRGALCCADKLTTVSPTYAEEDVYKRQCWKQGGLANERGCKIFKPAFVAHSRFTASAVRLRRTDRRAIRKRRQPRSRRRHSPLRRGHNGWRWEIYTLL